MQSRPPPVVVDDEDDDDDDPSVHHSSDEETQGLSSNLPPTTFRKGGRGLDSTPNRDDKFRRPVVKESPAPASKTLFANLMDQFGHSSSPSSTTNQVPDDSATAYGGGYRRSKLQQPSKQQQQASKQTGPSRAKPVHNMTRYSTIDDINDHMTEKKVEAMKLVRPDESIDRCMVALAKCKNNAQDAVSWLMAQDEEDAPGEVDDSLDELGSVTPVGARRGVAVPKSSSQQRPTTTAKVTSKQQVNAPTKSMAERYAQSQQARKQSQPSLVQGDDEDEEEDKPRPGRRLMMGRRPRRTPSPPSSPPAPRVLHASRRQAITISDDDDAEDEAIVPDATPEPEISSHDVKLLKFFNECSVRDLADTSAQPESVAQLIVDSRPFESLDVIRTISAANQATKSGKASRARPIGDKVVDVCSEMIEGYDAVDELVSKCEQLAKPIQAALKSWGVGQSEDGELELMKLDEAHDSGVGTPASSTASDDALANGEKSTSGSKARKFLGQPSSMNSERTLKDYQLVGLNWLNLLWSKGVSCILADDMGLGKTCQVISFLAHLQQQKTDGVHLVIVPGSTLENWMREFTEFAPELNVVLYYGSQDERAKLQYEIDASFHTIDVVVTTYDMTKSDSDNKFLRKHIDPVVCIYDEAHALRNADSLRYRQLMKIPAEFRILLTGTPLQNNLQELVAILAFIMTDMFREKHEQLQYIFKNKATTKNADHGALLSAERTARARSMMTPFILRRKKHQVLDLPAKHSRVEYCEMTVDQANYYADMVEEAQANFANQGIAGKGRAGKKANSHVLMALRKAAIHPLLGRRIYDDKKLDKLVAELVKGEFQGNPPDMVKAYLQGDANSAQKIPGGGSDYSLHRWCQESARDPKIKKFALKAKNPWMDSGKVKKCSALLKDFAKNGDRVLIFSQFTSMMDILEAVLETLGIRFMRLDGSTKMDERQSMIDKYNTDESITVFMLSTKAGGAGINLASANKVIIFDAGFNPQDDIQAENRAHRVGQTRDVEVIRLVTRGTIEEQIHALGESKLALDERVAGNGPVIVEDEKKGEELVEKMLRESLPAKKAAESAGSDLKDVFRNGLESAGVKVASKQAQF